MQRALKLYAHGHRAFDNALAMTMRTRSELRAGQAFGGALARHFHEAQLGYWQDVGACLVAPEAVLHSLIDGLLIFAALHIDEVGNDDATDIPQAHLAANLIRRLEIGLQD